MNIRYLLIATVSAAAFLSEAASAAPTLIGDTISFQRSYPDTSTQYGQTIPDTTVAAGSADAVTWAYFGGIAPVTINPEANTISLSFLTTTQYIGSGPTFDGFTISGLDNDISSVTVSSNFSGLSADLTHGERSIFINLSGFTNVNSSLTLTVDLKSAVSPVPEPATLPLLALGGVVLLARANRRSGATQRSGV